MTHCLASAAALLDYDEWFETAKKFVEKNILERKKLFYKIDREPKTEAREATISFLKTPIKH